MKNIYMENRKSINLKKDLIKQLDEIRKDYPELNSYQKVIEHLIDIRNSVKPQIEKKVVCKRCGDILDIPVNWETNKFLHRNFGKDCTGRLQLKLIAKKIKEKDEFEKLIESRLTEREEEKINKIMKSDLSEQEKKERIKKILESVMYKEEQIVNL